jgi:transposase InsO family protein
VFAQKILAWHAATVRDADLVLDPLKMAIWQRGREGHSITPGELIGHSDAGWSIHRDPVHRAPRARRWQTIDRVRRRRLR